MILPKELQPSAKTEIPLPDGGIAVLSVCKPIFKKWNGNPISFDYGKKPVLNHKEEACFAELVILRLLLDEGWHGVWIEAYGGTHFLRSMPQAWNLKSENVTIPRDKEELLKKIQLSGGTTACFDVLAWNDNQILFFEAKHAGKDKLTAAQLKFIEGALKSNIPQESLIIVEWESE